MEAGGVALDLGSFAPSVEGVEGIMAATDFFFFLFATDSGLNIIGLPIGFTSGSLFCWSPSEAVKAGFVDEAVVSKS